MSSEPRRAGVATRMLYCIALFSLFPATMGNTGWVGIALGGGILSLLPSAVVLLLAAAVLFRIYQVARYPHALDAFISGKAVWVLRWLSLIAMFVAAVGSVALFFLKPLTLLLMGNPGENGIGFFVVGMFGVMAASVGWKACLAFEISRGLGRAPQDAAPRPAFNRKQDGIVAASLAVLCVGVPYLRNATAPEPCGDLRIACVATLKSDVRRMIAAPLGTPVRLESTIHTVRMQLRSGSKVRWEAIENPSRSLKMTGYSPTEDRAVPLRVKIDASESNEGVTLDVRAFDADEETAHFSASFPKGTRLERDAQGRLNLLAELPSGSDTSIYGVEQDEEGGIHALDQLFVFMRQAIGTEHEAREHRVRISNPAVSIGQGDHVDDGRSAETIRVGEPIDPRCGDRLERGPGDGPRSGLEADLGAKMMQVTFRQSGAQFYVHQTDSLICSDETTWVVHKVPLDKIIRARRYAADGTLLRFVDSPLAYYYSDRFRFVDAMSVRETEDGVLFDQLETDDNIRDRKVVGRETFRIPLTRDDPRVLGAARGTHGTGNSRGTSRAPTLFR